WVRGLRPIGRNPHRIGSVASDRRSDFYFVAAVFLLRIGTTFAAAFAGSRRAAYELSFVSICRARYVSHHCCGTLPLSRSRSTAAAVGWTRRTYPYCWLPRGLVFMKPFFSRIFMRSCHVRI